MGQGAELTLKEISRGKPLLIIFLKYILFSGLAGPLEDLPVSISFLVWSVPENVFNSF